MIALNEINFTSICVFLLLCHCTFSDESIEESVVKYNQLLNEFSQTDPIGLLEYFQNETENINALEVAYAQFISNILTNDNEIDNTSMVLFVDNVSKLTFINSKIFDLQRNLNFTSFNDQYTLEIETPLTHVFEKLEEALTLTNNSKEEFNIACNEHKPYKVISLLEGIVYENCSPPSKIMFPNFLESKKKLESIEKKISFDNIENEAMNEYIKTKSSFLTAILHKSNITQFLEEIFEGLRFEEKNAFYYFLSQIKIASGTENTNCWLDIINVNHNLEETSILNFTKMINLEFIKARALFFACMNVAFNNSEINSLTDFVNNKTMNAVDFMSKYIPRRDENGIIQAGHF